MSNFILGRKQLENRIFPEKQPHSMRYEQAFVYVNKHQKYRVIQDGEALSRSELRLEKYHEMYVVDMKTYGYEFNGEVDAADRGRKFSVKLSIYFAVQDPGLLVQKSPGDIKLLLQNNIPDWIRRKARETRLSDLQKFENYLTGFYTDSALVSLLENVGVYIKDVSVLVDRSASDKEHDRKYAQVEDNQELDIYSSTLVTQQIYIALKNDDILTAINLAEGNQGIKEYVQSYIKKRNEFKDKIFAVICNSKIDSVERNIQIQTLQEAAEIYGINIGKNMEPAPNKSVMKELDDILYSIEGKG